MSSVLLVLGGHAVRHVVLLVRQGQERVPSMTPRTNQATTNTIARPPGTRTSAGLMVNLLLRRSYRLQYRYSVCSVIGPPFVPGRSHDVEGRRTTARHERRRTHLPCGPGALARARPRGRAHRRGGDAVRGGPHDDLPAPPQPRGAPRSDSRPAPR